MTSFHGHQTNIDHVEMHSTVRSHVNELFFFYNFEISVCLEPPKNCFHVISNIVKCFDCSGTSFPAFRDFIEVV